MDGNTIENVELAIRTPLPSSASSIELRNTEDASVTRPYDNATSATDTVHLDESTNPRNEINLAPVDGGIAAWSVVRSSNVRLSWHQISFADCLMSVSRISFV